jgi:hypothetical protein
MTKQKNERNYDGKYLKLGVSEERKEAGKIYVSTVIKRDE